MRSSEIIGHERPKAILKAALRRDRVAHAYLFHGEPGIGKRLTAIWFAQAISCDDPVSPEGGSSSTDPDACGACRACRDIESLTHPDFMLVEPDQEAANPQIKIEQVREIEQRMIYRPLIGQRKVCLIDEADRLTLGAANALLKTLEEPPDHSLFLLVTSRPSALPGTVRSRCQSLRFAPPPRERVEAALVTTRDMPPAEARFLAAMTEARIGEALSADLSALRGQQTEFSALLNPKTLRSVTTVLTAAEALHRGDRAPEALKWIGRWVRDLVLVRLGAEPELLLNHDHLAALRESAGQMALETLLTLLEELDAFWRAGSRNLNPQLVLESVLLRLRDAAQETSSVRDTRV